MADSCNNTSCASSGLLLIGHGTRDPRGLTEARLLATKVQAICPDVIVELCFLEMATPDIAAGVKRLVHAGVRKIRVVPLMLLAAGHVKQDIPAAVEAATDGLGSAPGDIEIEFRPLLGCHDHVVTWSEQRYAQTVGNADEAPADRVPAKDTLLVLVARGNRDAEAQEDWLEFVENRRRPSDSPTIKPAYLAMADPRLDEVLANAATGGHRRIVIQPHLLFAGQLLTRLQSQVSTFASSHPRQQWLVAQHLGPSQLLAAAVAQIASNRQCHNSRTS